MEEKKVKASDIIELVAIKKGYSNKCDNNFNQHEWCGWGVLDTQTNTLTEKILSAPHDTYDEAKNDREELKAPDIKTTDIFKANSRSEA